MDRKAYRSTQFCLRVGENRTTQAVAESIYGEDIYGPLAFPVIA